MLFEHYHEEFIKDRPRIVLKMPPRLAPVDVGIFPMEKNNPEQKSLAERVYKQLQTEGLIVTYDTGGSIGKRYRRLDEIGTPVCITIDKISLEDQTVTLRDRDTTKQIRLPIEEIYDFIRKNKHSHIFDQYTEVET